VIREGAESLVSRNEREEEGLSFDQLTDKQKMRLRAAGMTEADVMENPNLVLQILRANEGLDTEALRTFQLFRMIDKSTLGRIANQLRPAKFSTGEYVLRAGDPGDSMFFINSGKVAAIVNGEELEPMRMGQFFGEIALVSHAAVHMGQSGHTPGKRTADVICKQNCDLLELHKDVLLSVIDTAPKLYQALSEMAAKRLERDSAATEGSPEPDGFTRIESVSDQTSVDGGSTPGRSSDTHPYSGGVPGLAVDSPGGSPIKKPYRDRERPGREDSAGRVRRSSTSDSAPDSARRGGSRRGSTELGRRESGGQDGSRPDSSRRGSTEDARGGGRRGSAAGDGRSRCSVVGFLNSCWLLSFPFLLSLCYRAGPFPLPLAVSTMGAVVMMMTNVVRVL